MNLLLLLVEPIHTVTVCLEMEQNTLHWGKMLTLTKPVMSMTSMWCDSLVIHEKKNYSYNWQKLWMHYADVHEVMWSKQMRREGMSGLLSRCFLSNRKCGSLLKTAVCGPSYLKVVWKALGHTCTHSTHEHTHSLALGVHNTEPTVRTPCCINHHVNSITDRVWASPDSTSSLQSPKPLHRWAHT